MLPQFRLRKRKEPEVRVHSPAPVSAGAVRGLVFLLAEALVGLVLLGLALIFVLDRSNFRSPAMARVLADKLSETLEDRGFEIESVSFQLARADRFAGMTAYGVKLLDKNDNVLIAVPAVEVEFTLADLLRGEIRPLRLEVIGAEANLLRNEKGRISLTLGGKPNRLGGADAGLDGGGLERLVTGSENLADVPELSRLTEIAISNASVGYHDVVSGRDWQAESGFMVLRSQDEGYSASLKGRLLQPGSKDAVISVIATQNSDSGDTHVDFRVANVSPKDLASEFQALEWMRLLDAPVQANLLLDVSAAGELLAFSGGLDVGSGVVAAAGTAPVPFTSARARFAYDPATATFEIPTLTLDTGAASLQSAGSMQLVRDDAGHLTSLVTQLDLRDIRLDPAGMFEQPVGWPEGRAAVKVVLEPFTVTLGELVFFGDGTHVSLKGDIAAREAGWHYGLEMDAAGLSKDDLLRLWPVRLAQKARAWVAENVRTGQITQLNAAIRPGATRPSFVMQFEFDRARVRVVRFMPDVTEASGYGELNEKSFELNFLQGTIAEDGKGGVSVAGTRFHVPQYRMRPAPATVELHVDGELQPILALVNRDPLNLLDKAGIDPEVVAGHGAAKARLNFLMRKGLPLSNVGYDLTASLTRVASDRLVRGRSIAADEVTLRAADRQIKLEGKATLDGMPVDFAWSRALGRDAPDELGAECDPATGRGFAGDAGCHPARGQYRWAIGGAAGPAPESRTGAGLHAGGRLGAAGFADRRAGLEQGGRRRGQCQRVGTIDRPDVAGPDPHRRAGPVGDRACRSGGWRADGGRFQADPVVTLAGGGAELSARRGQGRSDRWSGRFARAQWSGRRQPAPHQSAGDGYCRH